MSKVEICDLTLPIRRQTLWLRLLRSRLFGKFVSVSKYMKLAKMVHLDGQVEQKQFVGVPKQRLFSYQKGDHGNIVGRLYFDIDPDQDLKANVVNYTEVAGPKPQ